MPWSFPPNSQWGALATTNTATDTATTVAFPSKNSRRAGVYITHLGNVDTPVLIRVNSTVTASSFTLRLRRHDREPLPLGTDDTLSVMKEGLTGDANIEIREILG